MAYVVITSTSSNSATVMIAGLQNPQNTYTGFRVGYNGQWSYIPVTGSTGDFTAITTVYGLPSGTYVVITGEAEAAGQWWSTSSAGAYTRPSGYAWLYPKVSGGNFNLTASEWNSFTSKINEFRFWKGLGGYGFTSAYTGNGFTASQYNEARSAIASMNSNIPPYRYSGETIYASDLNHLVSALNSVY